jgi:hypothetical protein
VRSQQFELVAIFNIFQELFFVNSLKLDRIASENTFCVALKWSDLPKLMNNLNASESHRLSPKVLYDKTVYGYNYFRAIIS